MSILEICTACGSARHVKTQNELIKLTTVWFEILCKLAISQSAINKETIHNSESSWVDVLGYFTAWPVYRGWDGWGWLGLYMNPLSTWYSYWVSAWQPKFSKTTLLWRSEYGSAENSWFVGWGDRDGSLAGQQLFDLPWEREWDGG